jgi:ubiquitin-protein ligase
MQSAKRRNRDVQRIIAAGYAVEIKDDKMSEFEVTFVGPPDSPYKGVSYTQNNRYSPFSISKSFLLTFL